jgi:hypothetical protein
MNENIFSNIDTKEKAYWLGFLYADGYIGVNNEKLQLCLSIVDELQIDKFIKFVGDSLDKKRYYGPYKTSGKQIHYYTRNKEIIKDLVKIGCSNKKSHIIRFPFLLSFELQISFLRGYYDGDGTGCYGHTDITCGSKDFLEDIKKLFSLNGVISRTTNKYETYRLCIGVDLYRKMIEIYPNGIYKKGINLDNRLSMKEYKDICLEIKTQKEDNKYKENIERNNLIMERKEDIKNRIKESRFKRRKFNISKDELQQLVNTIPMREIGKLFNVTDKAIAKRCILLGIQLKGRGYWTPKNI